MSNLAAIDYADLTDGLVTAFEGGVTTALPVVGAVIAAFLVIGTIKRVVGS
jgi:flagellar biosynthesis protein FliR